MAGSPNLCDKSWVTDQYDRYVRGNTVLAQPSDSGMIRVDEATGLGVAVSTDCNGRFAKLDPYAGAQLALAESYRNVATGGAQPLAISDCLNFGSPEDPDVMWQFAEACRGLAGRLPRARHPGHRRQRQPLQPDRRDRDPADPGGRGARRDRRRHTAYAVGVRRRGRARCSCSGETREELSGSEWAHVVHGHLGGLPPKVDLAAEKSLAELLREAVGLVTSAHDLAEGGLAQALVEAALGNDVGVRGRRSTATRSSALFAESAGAAARDGPGRGRAAAARPGRDATASRSPVSAGPGATRSRSRASSRCRCPWCATPGPTTLPAVFG